jgi:predicted  nucleic acid-binding Zn-ribbon protein
VNIEVFLSELTALNQKMDRGESSLTPEEKDTVLKKQLTEYRQKEEQIQKDIEREIDDFFAWAHTKRAGIEALNSMREYLRREITRLEELVQVERLQ